MKRQNIIEAMEDFGKLKQSIHRSMLPLFKQYDISAPQWYILRLLSKQKNGMTTTELADAAQITVGAVSQFVEQLAERDLIERHPSGDDRRVTVITLSPNAQERVSAFQTAHRKALSASFDALSDEELEQFITLLKKVSHHI